MLSSAMSLQHLEHSWLEVVVDSDARHASPELKSMALTEQKGFLPLGREAFHKHRPRKAESPGQEWHFDQLPTEFDRCFAKVKLCPFPRRKVERNKGWLRRRSRLLHEETHSGFSDGNPELAQFCPHAMGGPALFWCPALKPLILLKPFLNM